MTQASTPPSHATPGRLVLVPNALDHGCDVQTELSHVLPRAVIERAARITHWVVENAKPARRFLNRVDAVVPLSMPLQAMRITALPTVRQGVAPSASDWAALLQPTLEGHDVGLLSDAGMPALADPGALLVAQAHRMQVTVEPLTGPSAITLALAASGLDGQRFSFVGYLPIKEAERSQTLRTLDAHSRQHRQTQIAIETPYRNAALMTALVTTLSPSTRLGVACGLTLPNGWTSTRTVAQWRAGSMPTFAADTPAVFLWLAEG